MKKNYKLGLGPMSDTLIYCINRYALKHDYPIMLVASRNQIDIDSGYVMTTQKLGSFPRPLDMIMICRDHCGPYYLDSEKSLSESHAIEATKKTIEADINAGFELIHIDTSRTSNPYKIAEELIKFALDLKPSMLFEFGSEDNVGVTAALEKYIEDVNFAKQFPGMEFVVAQTGSLVMENRQVGGFNTTTVTKLVDHAKKSGVKLKEHNADYLDIDQISKRKISKVHAVNVAPQLGVMQTEVLKKLCMQFNLTTEWNEFAEKVLASNKWKKWHINCDDETKVLIAGHYLWLDESYKKILDKLQPELFMELVYRELEKILDSYRVYL